MALPTKVEDIDVYRNDPLTITCNFRHPDGTPMDVSLSQFTATLRGFEPDAGFAVDTSNAANGVVLLRLTKEQTGELLPFARWDVYESPVWERTLLVGRLVRVDDV